MIRCMAVFLDRGMVSRQDIDQFARRPRAPSLLSRSGGVTISGSAALLRHRHSGL